MTLIKSISGIRGIIGGKPDEGLTPVDIVKYTSAYVNLLKDFSKGKKIKVVIGRDARLSGEMISKIVVGTLLWTGADVIDIGLASTPTVEIAVVDENADGGIIITASHNSKQWNALKFLNEKGEFISEHDWQQIQKFADEGNYEYSSINRLGNYKSDDSYIQKHINKILNLSLVDVNAIKKANFRIVIDCINSVGGIIIPKLLKALGVFDIIEINCEPSGNFVHEPEPIPDNLRDLSTAVKKFKAHLGFAVDPDVDRLAIVSEDGEMFGEEYTLVAVADYVLQHKKGDTVSNLSSTRALQDITIKAGCKYFASAVGEVNVIEMMKQTNSVIGGEGNGGVIYPELHYGRDALVGIALFLSFLADYGKSCSMLRVKFPNYYISKNKIELDPTTDIEEIFNSIKKRYKQYKIDTTDGLKIEFDNNWVHLRKSNTEPIIRIYAESNTLTTANHLANKLISDIKEIIA